MKPPPELPMTDAEAHAQFIVAVRDAFCGILREHGLRLSEVFPVGVRRHRAFHKVDPATGRLKTETH